MPLNDSGRAPLIVRGMTASALPFNDRLTLLSPAAASTHLDGDFELAREDGLQIIRSRAGVKTTLLNGIDYTFPTGPGGPSGFRVDLVVATLAGDAYALIGLEPIERLSDFEGRAAFSADKFDADLDQLVRHAQEARRDIDRAVTVEHGEDGMTILPGVAGQLVGYDDDPSVLKPVIITADGVVMTPFMAGFIAAADDAADARSLLSVPLAADVTAALAGKADAAATAAAIALKADAARTITAAGLATGGGDLSADRTITVTAASDAEAIAGAITNKAMTPANAKAALEANGTRGWTYSSVIATTSGSAWDFTGLPSWVSEVEVFLNQVSLSGTDTLLLRLGPVGGVEATGYVGSSSRVDATTISAQEGTAAFVFVGTVAANAFTGVLRLARRAPGDNTWFMTSVFRRTTTDTGYAAGLKAIAGTLSIIRLLASGSNTGDGGDVALRYR